MINVKHKDRLFCFIFGREENKKWTLSLYNAVNQSTHKDPDIIEITTMEDVLYMGMKNDVSFIIANIVSVYEQQSTYNPNMPVREMMPTTMPEQAQAEATLTTLFIPLPTAAKSFLGIFRRSLLKIRSVTRIRAMA